MLPALNGTTTSSPIDISHLDMTTSPPQGLPRKSHRNVIEDTIVAGKYIGVFRIYSQFTIQNEHHPFLLSELAMEIYTILALYIFTWNYWILHGITLVIGAHIVDVLLSWFLHIKEAREIRLFKSWLFWWVRIGLNIASTTMEMDVMHLVVAHTLTFWNWIAKQRIIKFFDNIDHDRRLSRAKEQYDQLILNHNNFADGLQDSLRRNPG